jgi:hypothetical protein
MVVVMIVRVIWMVFFTGSRKASKEEQGRKCYDNDSEERHLVGHEGTGHSTRAEEHRLVD